MKLVKEKKSGEKGGKKNKRRETERERKGERKYLGWTFDGWTGRVNIRK